MPQRIQWHSKVTLHTSAHPEREQDQTENLAMVWIDYKVNFDMVSQSWIINCLKMYKILDEVINFIEKTMNTWRVELTAGGRSWTETKIRRVIFQGDALSPLIFKIATLLLNHILRKCRAGWHETINHLMYMDDIKLFAKNRNNWKIYHTQ